MEYMTSTLANKKPASLKLIPMMNSIERGETLKRQRLTLYK